MTDGNKFCSKLYLVLVIIVNGACVGDFDAMTDGNKSMKVNKAVSVTLIVP
jgi:hypothetical protein